MHRDAGGTAVVAAAAPQRRVVAAPPRAAADRASAAAAAAAVAGVAVPSFRRPTVAARFHPAHAPSYYPRDGGTKAEREQAAELPLPTAVECAVDDPLLRNPLERARRIGTGWCGVVLDFEGAVVAPAPQEHRQAWRLVALERGLPAPLEQHLSRVGGGGAHADAAVAARVLCWTNQPEAAAALAKRKHEVFEQLLRAAADPGSGNGSGNGGGGGGARRELPGLRDFLAAMAAFDVPVAVASTLPTRHVVAALDALGLAGSFAAVTGAEDAGADGSLEGALLAAAHAIGRPPLRCAFISAAAPALDAARDAGMRAVGLAAPGPGGAPAWALTGADLVVRSHAQLSVSAVRALFAREEPVEPRSGGGGGGGGGALRGEFASASSAASSSAAADSVEQYHPSPAGASWRYAPFDDRDGAEDGGSGGFDGGAAGDGSGGLASSRERWAYAGAGAAADAGDSAVWRARADDEEVVGMDVQEQVEEEEFEVVLPPKGAACWD